MHQQIKDARAAVRRANLGACVFPLIFDHGDNSGIHGSGLLFKRAGRVFLVTAAHVAEDLPSYIESIGIPAVKFGSNAAVHTLGSGKIAMAPEGKGDVAVFRLDDIATQEKLASGGRVVLTDHDVNTSSQAQRYLVFGWPHSKIRLKNTTIFGTAVYAFLSQIPRPLTALGPEMDTDIFLEWPDSPDVPRLEGISGSPIWAVRSIGDDEVWEPSKEIKLVGIQHAVRKGEYIRGTSWEMVDRLIQSLM